MSNIIAFDIGVHHFAYAVLSIHEKEWDISHMNVEDLAVNQKCSSIVLEQNFWVRFHSFLRSLHEILKTCSFILIERQMSFSNAFNYKANQINSQLFAHMIIYFPEKKIINYSATEKTKQFQKQFKKKIDRKKWAIEFTKELLLEKNDETAIEWLNSFPKQDDICDCILMVLSFAKKNSLLY